MKRKSIFIVTLVSTLGVAGLILGILGLTGNLSIGTTPDVVVVPTDYEIAIHDALDSTNDDEIDDAATINWYRAKIASLEEDEIEDIAFADYSADGTGDDKNPDEDYIYLAKISGTDLVEKWFTTDSRVFEGNIPLLSLGVNDVYIYNETEDIAMAAYCVGGVTALNTTYRDWTIVLSCLDATESITADVTSLEGYGYSYDPEDGAWLTPVIAVGFNITATAAHGALQTTYDVTEATSGNVLYFEIQSNISGITEFDLRLGSLIGTTLGVVEINVGWGYSGSFTEKDMQA